MWLHEAYLQVATQLALLLLIWEEVVDELRWMDSSQQVEVEESQLFCHGLCTDLHIKHG